METTIELGKIKLTSLAPLFTCILVIAGSKGAFAQTDFAPSPEQSNLNMTVSQFRAQIDHAQTICPTLHCANSPVQIKPLGPSEAALLDPALKARFQHVCQHIAENEWPETILDGPFVANFQVQVRNIEALFVENQLLGYRIGYEDQVWETSNCKYNPQVPSSLQTCKPGKFIEAAFISKEGKEYFRDPQSFVEFIAL